MNHLFTRKIIEYSLLLLFLLLTVSISKAQFNQTIFYDSLNKISTEGYIQSGLGDGKYIYLSGSSFSKTKPLPTVTKIDTAGNVIWTATDNNNYQSFEGFENFVSGIYSPACNATIKSGNRIYTVAGAYRAGYLGGSHFEVWCLSDSTGTLLWKLGLDYREIVKLTDYNATELLAVSSGTEGNYCYVINKATGAIIQSKQYGSNSYEADVLVDSNHNILVSYGNYCHKYQGNNLDQLLWSSSISYFGTFSPIDKITQAGDHYIFMGRDNVRAVDTLTGNTIWYTPVDVGHIVAVQGGDHADPVDYILKDSLLYITWTAAYFGGVDLNRGFTLTCLNIYNGNIKYNVAYDFTGVPADTPPTNLAGDGVDYPKAMCMDANQQIYMTGTYDETGTWGIMKIDGTTGAKIYEATITNDSTTRNQISNSKFICYYDGKVYSGGNLLQKGQKRLLGNTQPTVVAFDTGAVYKEKYRISPYSSVRYSSALTAIKPLGSSKMALLKRVGRSGMIEVRSNNNKLIWSKSFNTNGKFWIPQSMEVLADTAIAASFISYSQDTATKILVGDRDSILFVSLDTLGNFTFRRSIKYKTEYDLSPMPVYTDKTGRTNFLFRSTKHNAFAYKGYMLNGTADSLDYVSNYIEVEPYDYDRPALKVMPVQHYNGDTMIVYQAGLFNSGEGWLKSATQKATAYTGYTFYGFHELHNFEKTYSALKIGSASYFIMGRDMKGHVRGDLYNYNLARPVVWSYNPSVNGTMYNADTSSTALYTISKSNGNTLSVTKIDRLTGKVNWNYEKMAEANTISIMPVDFKYDKINNYFCIGGFIKDATITNTGASYFYLVIDSSGKPIKDIKVAGYGVYDTKINSVDILPNGTHLIGGIMSTNQFGTVGWYSSDCFGNNLVPGVSITASDTVICTGTSVTFTASATLEGNNPTYQWQINGKNVGNNNNIFTTSELKDNDEIKVILTSNANCLQLSQVSSNGIIIKVSPQLVPTITISGITSVEAGQSSTITSNVTNAGINTIYQWQDSTHIHHWQNISNAAAVGVNYKPAISGDAIRCVLKSNNTCTAQNAYESNTLRFTVNKAASDSATMDNGGVVFYPNPVTDILTIDSLSLDEQWQTIEIISLTGNRHLSFKNIENQTKVTLNIEQLPKGVYIAILQRKQKKPVHLKFMKL